MSAGFFHVVGEFHWALVHFGLLKSFLGGSLTSSTFLLLLERVFIPVVVSCLVTKL